MNELNAILNRLKELNEAWESGRDYLNEDAMVDVALACELADWVSYLIKTVEEHKQVNEQLKNQVLTEEEIEIIQQWGFTTSTERPLSEDEKELYFKITNEPSKVKEGK